MIITLLANNPIYLERNNNNKQIKKLIRNSDIFIRFKFKSLKYFNKIQKKQEDIIFRYNISTNRIMGYDNFINSDTINEVENKKMYIINDNNLVLDIEREDELTKMMILRNIRDVKKFIISKDHKLIDKIKKKKKIDTSILSTGIITIIKYYLLYPEAEFKLLGFFNDSCFWKERNDEVSIRTKKLGTHSYNIEKDFIIRYIKNVEFFN
tara:strand:+ start:636 stop:1262 length:627 start_codon:yes stop_codon:yes gene_type:complete